MRRLPQVLAIAACASLLGLQLSGLHVHAGGDGFDATLHGTHVHGAGAHVHDAGLAAAAAGAPSRHAHERSDEGGQRRDRGDERHDPAGGRHDPAGGRHDPGGGRHDHGDYRDVAVVELAAGAAKLPVFLVGPALEVIAAPPVSVAVRGPASAKPPSARGVYWRPPLRGPPRLSVRI